MNNQSSQTVTNLMFGSLFQSKKEKRREEKNRQVDDLAAKSLKMQQVRAQELADNLSMLTKLVEKHGVSGIFFESTGAGRRSREKQ